MKSEVEAYIGKVKDWHNEIVESRKILLECGLQEDIKWGKPCYSYEGANIIVIQGFKEYFAFLFMKGYLLDDPEGILTKTGPNTRVGRQIKFKDVKEIKSMKSTIKDYVKEAIRVEKEGVKGEPKEKREIELPAELEEKLGKDKSFQKAWEALTPGRQNGYLFHFSGAKQSKTRVDRIEKNVSKIMDGKGLNDYKPA